MTSVTFVRGCVKMADLSSDDDMLRLLQIQTSAVVMQMRRKKKRAPIRFYKRLIFAQRKEHGDYQTSPHNPRYPRRYSVAHACLP